MFTSQVSKDEFAPNKKNQVKFGNAAFEKMANF